MGSSERTPEGAYDQTLARAARVNALGTGAKLLHPLVLVLVARLYGPEVVGLYLLAVSFLELAASVLVGGFKDGIVMFGGRGDPKRDEDHRASVYGVMATSVSVVAVCCAALVLSVSLGGQIAIDAFFSRDETAVATGRELAAVLPVLVWVLPAIAVMELGIAATKSLMIMEYDTIIVGVLRPVLLGASAVIAWFFLPDLQGLAWAYLLTHALLAGASIWAFVRHFSLREVGRRLVGSGMRRELLGFAVPQSLNLTLNNFITNVDRLMLGYFGISPELIGFYGIAATVMRNIRHAKLAFSGAFSPVIARLHAEGRIRELEESFGVVARWALTIALPVLVVVLGLRQEILRVFHSSYTGDSAFMVLLAIPPLLSCWIGLAGNIVVMTGHSRWNLFNSVVVGVTNALLNALWIPQHGLWGAALATAVSTIAVSLLQLVEAKLLVGVRARLDLVRKPLLAGVAAALVLIGTSMAGDGSLVRALAAILAVVVYVVLLFAMGIDPRDRDLLRFRKPRLLDPTSGA
jgi:O-antigen/teichoic acid export membrane protein